MTWIPGTPLTSAEVTSMNIEASSMALLNEFLTGYFTGTTHTVDGAAVMFPIASFIYQQAQIPAQPLEGLAINCVYAKPGRNRRYGDFRHADDAVLDERYLFCDLNITLMLMASVSAARTDGLNSQGLIQLGADRMVGLLLHKQLTKPLSQKRIFRISVAAPGKLVGSTDFYTRMVDVKCLLQFPIGGA